MRLLSVWTIFHSCGNGWRNSSDDKHSSSRKCTPCFTCSESAKFNCLQDSTLCSKHFSVLYQMLKAGDNQLRLDFANKFLILYDKDSNWPLPILWTDETQFTLTGCANSKNYVYWADNDLFQVHYSMKKSPCGVV